MARPGRGGGPAGSTVAALVAEQGHRVLVAERSAESKPGFPEHTSGGRHHIGTARMSDDPRRGVTDSHGRVHGLPDLYIAGSALFPTCGSANPTLTLVALALRQAARLRRELTA
jgi:choline dehydrogenase-like flavoprotein